MSYYDTCLTYICTKCRQGFLTTIPLNMREQCAEAWMISWYHRYDPRIHIAGGGIINRALHITPQRAYEKMITDGPKCILCMIN